MIKKIIKYSAYAAFLTVPPSTPTDLTAQMNSQISDVGFLAVVVLVVGIPLTFYVVRKLIGLFPKDKARAEYKSDPGEDRADKATIKYLSRIREVEHYNLDE